MAFFGKKSGLNFEKYKGFTVQGNYNCNGDLKTLFIELERPVDTEFIEYMKPFGYPHSLPGNIFEIRREDCFKLMIPIGRTGFQAKFSEDFPADSKELLIKQVYRGLKRYYNAGLNEKCPEKAFRTELNRWVIDTSKCTFCLKCV